MAGVATGLLAVALLSPVAGLQMGVPLVVLTSVALSPWHRPTSGPTLSMGSGCTATVTLAVAMHPFASVPDTLNCTLLSGVAVGALPVLPDSQVAGDHV